MLLSIGAFSRYSKISTKTLRHYDDIGLLKPTYVNEETGYRYYSADKFRTILLIQKFKKYNFSLDEIIEIFEVSSDTSSVLLNMRLKYNMLQEKINNYTYTLKKLNTDIINLERGIDIMSYLDNIEVKLIETQDKNVLFVRDEMNINKFREYMQTLNELLINNKYTPLGPPISIYHSDKEFKPNTYDIEIAIPVKEVTNKTRNFSGYQCAMATLKGNYSELVSIYAKINKWIETEKYQIIDSPYEIYLTDPSRTLAEENITEVYFPVKKLEE